MKLLMRSAAGQLTTGWPGPRAARIFPDPSRPMPMPPWIVLGLVKALANAEPRSRVSRFTP
ncbi:MAG TPA: hypothetical protein VK447_12290, partial [Myxococcaceae bacterium]|nr:hypothetical protein [Myxococcaceae bacterium]